MAPSRSSSGDAPKSVAPATGRLGILTPGLGAVATTFMAGVESIRRGRSKPIGSLTQMATIRLGKRTDKNSPLIRDFVPLAKLDDIVFGAWDPIPDDALTAAKARHTDSVIVDTAGRLHTKTSLMAELEKMKRTAQRIIPGAPHEVLLVMDATTGQNGLQQARLFTESAGVTGIVLTKLDGTAKGGVVIAISRELGLPVRYVGVGEKAGDLLPFDAENFADSLFSTT